MLGVETERLEGGIMGEEGGGISGSMKGDMER